MCVFVLVFVLVFVCVGFVSGRSGLVLCCCVCARLCVAVCAWVGHFWSTWRFAFDLQDSRALDSY